MPGVSTICTATCGSGLLQPMVTAACAGVAAGAATPGAARLALGSGILRTTVTATSASALSLRICELEKQDSLAERVRCERTGDCPARDARVRGSEKRQAASPRFFEGSVMASQFRTFVLPRVSDDAAEQELNAFLRSHRIATISRTYDEGSWCICVEWLEGKVSDTGVRVGRFPERVDYMKILPPEVFVVFSRLREKRKALSQDAGVPPFAVATDAQLAEMARIVEPSENELGKIEGFGESRLKAYGAAFLSVLKDSRA